MMNLSNDTEIVHLFSRIAAGDEKAFVEVFNRYNDVIYSTALQYCKTRQLSEDVVQQVFMTLWDKRSMLNEVENGIGWLWTITRNQAISILKRESRKESYITYAKELFSIEQDTPLQKLELRLKRNLIDTAINDLSPRQQQVYRMSRYEGATYAQIGEKLGIGAETVKEHIAKALKAIRQRLSLHRDDLLFFLIILFKIFFS